MPMEKQVFEDVMYFLFEMVIFLCHVSLPEGW